MYSLLYVSKSCFLASVAYVIIIHAVLDDFFETEISSDNFLKPALSNLFEALDSQALSSSLDAMRKRLFVFVQKKFNLYVDSSDPNDRAGVGPGGGAINLHMCDATKFNLMEEDMPVVVTAEEIRGYDFTDEQTEGEVEGADKGVFSTKKGVTFADECDMKNVNELENDVVRVRGKWDDIDAALGLTVESEDTDQMQVDDAAEQEPEQFLVYTKASSSSEGGGGNSVKSNILLQESMFSWRYALLYDEMVRNNAAAEAIMGALRGKEDLTMTAMRIIESTQEFEGAREQKEATSEPAADAQSGDKNKSEPLKQDQLRAEAVRFVRDEISLW
jgi:hypothetical protein